MLRRNASATSPPPDMPEIVGMQVENRVKPPEHNFIDSEADFESSIRNKNIWIDSFFTIALIWAFGSVLNEQGRK